MFEEIKATKIHVRLYSDSLGLPRPQLNITNEDRYISILLRYWECKYGTIPEIIDRARGDMSIMDIYKWFNEDCGYFGKIIDVLIIHNGIVDCAPRPIPLRVRKIVSHFPKILQIPIVNILHKNRSLLLKLGIRYYVTSSKKYYKNYRNLIEKAIPLSKNIYLINIAPTNTITENHSPGFTKSINKYNEIIRRIIDELDNKNIHLIDIHSFISSFDMDIDDLINHNDGHHITKKTHELLAKIIIQMENQR